MNYDLLIVGGGTGGTAAALAAASKGLRVLMTEETDWIGGQLTAQAVPPDEHPWIERFGCTRRYRAYREGVRAYYRSNFPLTPAALGDPELNPGGGWVSKLCHSPVVGHAVLQAMVAGLPSLDIRLRRKPVDALTEGDYVRAVRFVNLETGEHEIVKATWVIDATELGDLLAIAGVEYLVGAESQADYGEPHGLKGAPEPDNVQGLTWVYAVGYDPHGRDPIEKPRDYDKWRAYKPDFWPGPLLGFTVLHAHTGVEKQLPLFNPHDWYELFTYRQIVDATVFTDDRDPATIVNWPQNDYFEASILDVEEQPEWGHPMPGASGPVSAARLEQAQQLSYSLLYWLQTEAPRHDGGIGYPEIYLRPDLVGTTGLAKYPYIRESRRLRARQIVREQDVATYTNPGRDRAPEMADTIGVGAYRLDLHPSTNGANTIDTSTLPFQIPMGAIVPERVRNLLAGAKNLGVTHLANGCYRLHPIEWNVGEAAGLLAAFCTFQNTEPTEVYENPELRNVFQNVLHADGIELAWPQLRAL